MNDLSASVFAAFFAVTLVEYAFVVFGVWSGQFLGSPELFARFTRQATPSEVDKVRRIQELYRLVFAVTTFIALFHMWHEWATILHIPLMSTFSITPVLAWLLTLMAVAQLRTSQLAARLEARLLERMKPASD